VNCDKCGKGIDWKETVYIPDTRTAICYGCANKKTHEKEEWVDCPGSYLTQGEKVMDKKEALKAMLDGRTVEHDEISVRTFKKDLARCIANIPIDGYFIKEKPNKKTHEKEEWVDCPERNTFIPKRKTQTFEFWVNVYRDGSLMYFKSKEDADKKNPLGSLASKDVSWERLGEAERVVITRDVE